MALRTSLVDDVLGGVRVTIERDFMRSATAMVAGREGEADVIERSRGFVEVR